MVLDNIQLLYWRRWERVENVIMLTLLNPLKTFVFKKIGLMIQNQLCDARLFDRDAHLGATMCGRAIEQLTFGTHWLF